MERCCKECFLPEHDSSIFHSHAAGYSLPEDCKDEECECHATVKHWTIEVPAWGTLYATGTEEQAEEWRRHKANWEQSVARKRESTPEEIGKEEYKALKDLLN